VQVRWRFLRAVKNVLKIAPTGMSGSEAVTGVRHADTPFGAGTYPSSEIEKGCRVAPLLR